MTVDAVLALLPDVPLSFQSLPPDERAWRGRAFLMTWLVSNDELFSWSIALAFGPSFERGMRDTVSGISDQQVIEAVTAARQERAPLGDRGAASMGR